MWQHQIANIWIIDYITPGEITLNGIGSLKLVAISRVVVGVGALALVFELGVVKFVKSVAVQVERPPARQRKGKYMVVLCSTLYQITDQLVGNRNRSRVFVWMKGDELNYAISEPR